MTREEAIAYGKKVIDLGLNDETQAFCELAIKALEQESTLDKIRAEIEQTAKDYDKFDDYRRVRGLWMALEIIDKYKAEM